MNAHTVTVTARLNPISADAAARIGRPASELTAARADDVTAAITNALTRSGATVTSSQYVPHLPLVIVEAEATDLYRVSVAVDNVRRIVGGTGHANLVDWTSGD